MAPARHRHNLSGDNSGCPVAGLDEAGRGCLAGPVVAAAVILPHQPHLPGLDDSKRLSPTARQSLAPKIRQSAIAWSLGVVWPRRIDEINILQASLEAMALAARNLKVSPRLLLLDGNQLIAPSTFRKIWPGDPPPQKAIIGGDRLIASISAASILAKTFRDKLMIALGRLWPHYEFERHKGYGTKRHLLALRKFGPCRMHRLTFRGVQPDSAARRPLIKLLASAGEPT